MTIDELTAHHKFHQVSKVDQQRLILLASDPKTVKHVATLLKNICICALCRADAK